MVNIDIYRDWLENYQTLYAFGIKALPEDRRRISLAILQSHSKVSTLSTRAASYYGIQSSPLFSESCRYHRNTANSLLEKVDQVAVEALGLAPQRFQLVNSPLIRENLRRELAGEGCYNMIGSEEDFNAAFEELFSRDSSIGLSLEMSLFDFSLYMERLGISPSQFEERVVRVFEEVIKKRCAESSSLDSITPEDFIDTHTALQNLLIFD